MATAASIQGAIAASNLRWYAGLLKPNFSPTPWLAAIASVALSACLAFGFFRILCCPDYLPDRPAAIRVFLVGLALDVVWSWLFFAGRHPSAALAAAGLLAVVATSAAWRFATVDRRAGLLLAPWVFGAGFVFLVDLSIALRNG